MTFVSFVSFVPFKGAFTPNVNSVLSEDLGGIFDDTQCEMGDCLILSEC